jgi:hypothetical protein
MPHLKKSATTGHLLKHPTSGHLAKCPDVEVGDACDECPDDTPRFIHLAFANVDLCDVLGCDPSNRPGSLGDYCCVQSEGDPCRWVACEPDVGCTTTDADCIGFGTTVNVTRLSGSWLIEVNDVELGGANVWFKGTISTSDCATGGTANNDSTGCGNTAGGYTYVGENGSVTLTPFSC